MLEFIIKIMAVMMAAEKNIMTAFERRARFMRSKLADNVRDMMAAIRAGRVKSFISMQKKNKKMGPTENIGFLIFSIPAVFTCPYATGLCMKYCYCKSDYRFDSITKSHVRNWVESQKADFIENCVKYIHDAIYTKKGDIRKAFRKKDGTLKDICIRIHEAGDFYNETYFLKWCEIARRCPDYKFYAYTKSIPIVCANMENIPNNFIVRCSIFPDTKREYLEMIFKNRLPFYMAMNKEHVDGFPYDYNCNCAAGCGACGNMCSNRTKKAIVTELKK